MTTNRKNVIYSEDQLKSALEAIKSGKMSINKASRSFSVPRTTLYDKINEKYVKQSRAGAPTIFTNDEEDKLLNWIMELGRIGFPVTKHQILHSVGKLYQNLNKNSPNEKLPGKKWYAGFLKRHPQLSKRVSQNLTTSRASVSELDIRSWFDRVRNYMTDNDHLDVLEDPSRIFNCDETAFYTSPKGDNVIVKKGQKHVYSRISNDEKECLTVLLGSSADGNFMPSLVLYPYKRLPMNILNVYPTGWPIGKTDSGWMTCEAFYEYITNSFYPYLVNNNIKLPVVLFLDGHVSHLSFPLGVFCRDKGIILIALLPNSTHLLQPMDVALFHPLKQEWKKTVCDWKMKNCGQKLGRSDFAPLVEKCLDVAGKPQTIKNGFRRCGLYPFDVEAVNFTVVNNIAPENGKDSTKVHELGLTDTELNAKSTFKRRFEDKLGPEKVNLFKSNIGDWNGPVEDLNLFKFWKQCRNDLQLSSCNPSLELQIQPQQNIELDDFENLFSERDVIDCEILEDGAVVISSFRDLSERNLFDQDESVNLSYDKFIQDLDQNRVSSLIPISSEQIQTTSSKTFKKPSCEPSTSTPFKDALFWPQPSTSKKPARKRLIPTVVSSTEFIAYQQQIQENKENKQKRKRKNNVVNDNDNDRNVKRKKSDKNADVEPQMKFKIDEYVVVVYEQERFPGVIKDVKENYYQIKTMLMCGMNWKWPDNDEIDWYSFDQIIGKIEPPKRVKSRSNIYSLNMNIE